MELETALELLLAAHSLSFGNSRQIANSKVAGCFCCQKRFRAVRIESWVDDSPSTALCPYCGIDAVLGDASGLRISPVFLRVMNCRWFGDVDGVTAEEIEQAFECIPEDKHREFIEHSRDHIPHREEPPEQDERPAPEPAEPTEQDQEDML